MSPPIAPDRPSAARDRRYWRRTRALTAVLLLLWVLVSFVLPFHARGLNFSFFGWSFSFWLASQGALLVYLLILVLYAWAMGRLDQRYRDEQEPVEREMTGR